MSHYISNFKNYYRKLNFIYSLLFLGLLLFMTVVYFFTKRHQFEFTDRDLKWIYLSLFGAVLVYFVSVLLKKRLSFQARQFKDIREKLDIYRSYYIINLGIVEAYGFMNTIWFLNTQNLVFLIFAAYSILLFLLMKPHPDKIIYLSGLNSSQQVYINEMEKPFD